MSHAHSANLSHETAANRRLITVSVMLTTIMQGSMAATQKQISWVLTSYITIAAIFMPLTGFYRRA